MEKLTSLQELDSNNYPDAPAAAANADTRSSWKERRREKWQRRRCAWKDYSTTGAIGHQDEAATPTQLEMVLLQLAGSLDVLHQEIASIKEAVASLEDKMPDSNVLHVEGELRKETISAKVASLEEKILQQLGQEAGLIRLAVDTNFGHAIDRISVAEQHRSNDASEIKVKIYDLRESCAADAEGIKNSLFRLEAAKNHKKEPWWSPVVDFFRNWKKQRQAARRARLEAQLKELSK